MLVGGVERAASMPTFRSIPSTAIIPIPSIPPPPPPAAPAPIGRDIGGIDIGIDMGIASPDMATSPPPPPFPPFALCSPPTLMDKGIVFIPDILFVDMAPWLDMLLSACESKDCAAAMDACVSICCWYNCCWCCCCCC